MARKKDIVDADDGGLANLVGEWTKDKHRILTHYVGITSAVRRKFTQGSSQSGTYIDLYCAMGRSKIRETDEFIDGSPVAAWKESQSKGVPFTDVYIGDKDQDAIDQCSKRLREAGANPVTFNGDAADMVHDICDRLNPDGYHLAFVDPFSLGALPFSVIERLCRVKYIDLLIHVSSFDLQRNLNNFLIGAQDSLDTFAPGWRESIPDLDKARNQRTAVFHYWQSKITQIGKNAAQGIEHFTGSKGQTLYWLVLVSGHPKAEELWDKIRNVSGQGRLF